MQISHMLQQHPALTLIRDQHPSCFGGCLGTGSFWVPLLNLIKQQDPLRWIRVELSLQHRGLFMLLLKSRGPGLACITHRKTLGSSQTVQAPAVRPLNPSLLASYKEQTGPAEATSKELSFTPRAPPPSPFPPLSQEGNVSVQEWKCCSRRDVDGWRRQCYL